MGTYVYAFPLPGQDIRVDVHTRKRLRRSKGQVPMEPADDPKPKRDWRCVNRSTSRLELKLSPELLLQLRTSAKVRGLTIARYIATLLEQEHTPGAAAFEIALADVSRLASAASDLPSELKRLHGELLRQGGLAKHLYLEGADPEATARALFGLQTTAKQIASALKDVLASHAELRMDLERAARLLAGRV